MNEKGDFLSSEEQVAISEEMVGNLPTGLRQIREAQGMHVAALAAALKVPVKKLEALEAGRYEELPDLTFARALASSACRHLKVDPAPILERFPQAHAPLLGGDSNGVNAPFKGDTGALPSPSFDGRKNPAVVIAGVVLVAALGVAFLPAWDDMPGKNLWNQAQTWMLGLGQSGTTTVETQVVLPQAGEDQSPVVTTLTTTTVPASLPEQGGTVPLEAKPAELKIETALADVSAPAATSQSVLHLQAISDSWVEVLDGAGKVQVQRVMKKGDVLDFTTTPPYSVVLGRSDAVAIQVRGKPFDVAPYARNSVARFQVK